MTTRLTQEQLKQIVAEVERLSQRRDAEIESEQVKEILQELNLPPELLDEALMQLRRREALEVQKKRNRAIMAGVAAVFLMAIGSTIFFMQQNQQALSRVVGERDRITFAQDDGGNLTTISRQNRQELFYRVTLKDAPIDQKLTLACNWIDPNGEIAKQNRYQTQKIDRPVWDTHCRYTIGNAAPTGNWQVKMFLDRREISHANFQVK